MCWCGTASSVDDKGDDGDDKGDDGDDKGGDGDDKGDDYAYAYDYDYDYGNDKGKEEPAPGKGLLGKEEPVPGKGLLGKGKDEVLGKGEPLPLGKGKDKFAGAALHCFEGKSGQVAPHVSFFGKVCPVTCFQCDNSHHVPQCKSCFEPHECQEEVRAWPSRHQALVHACNDDYKPAHFPVSTGNFKAHCPVTCQTCSTHHCPRDSMCPYATTPGVFGYNPHSNKHTVDGRLDRVEARIQEVEDVLKSQKKPGLAAQADGTNLPGDSAGSAQRDEEGGSLGTAAVGVTSFVGVAAFVVSAALLVMYLRQSRALAAFQTKQSIQMEETVSAPSVVVMPGNTMRIVEV